MHIRTFVSIGINTISAVFHFWQQKNCLWNRVYWISRCGRPLKCSPKYSTESETLFEYFFHCSHNFFRRNWLWILFYSVDFNHVLFVSTPKWWHLSRKLEFNWKCWSGTILSVFNMFVPAKNWPQLLSKIFISRAFVIHLP